VSAANKITLARITLIPLLLVFLVHEGTTGDRWIALAIFLLASATDWLDGYVARSRGQVTVLGKLLDPVADKLLVTAALLPLVRDEMVSDWMAALLIGREFLITGLRSVASAEGVVIPAGAVGKWKMGMSITAISFLIVVPNPHAPVWPRWVPDGTYLALGTGFLWATLALSLASAALYFWEYRHFIRVRKDTPAAS
jgi:CDP-diacylglycerol--glycerol-3-phosphate 3-phosphatidyltransferase